MSKHQSMGFIPPDTEVHFNDLVPVEVVEALRGPVSAAMRYAPSWLHDLRVEWVPESDNAAACTIVGWVEYRFAKLRVRPLFLDADGVERHNHILHEILHLTFMPLDDLIRDVIDPLEKKNRHLYGELERRREHLIEGAIVDMTRALRQRGSHQ